MHFFKLVSLHLSRRMSPISLRLNFLVKLVEHFFRDNGINSINSTIIVQLKILNGISLQRFQSLPSAVSIWHVG